MGIHRVGKDPTQGNVKKLNRLQQAFKQLDRLLEEKEQMEAEKEKVRELYEKKLVQMRRQFQERLNQTLRA